MDLFIYGSISMVWTKAENDAVMYLSSGLLNIYIWHVKTEQRKANKRHMGGNHKWLIWFYDVDSQQ